MEWPRIFTAMVTPFDQEGRLDEEYAGILAKWLVRNGSDGLIIAGTTGESPSLSDDEKYRLYQAVRTAVGRDVPVWVGTGSNNTYHSRQLSESAAQWGADGVLVVCPYYNKPPQEGLYQHFVTIAQDLSIPVMLYNVPGRTGVNLEPETARRVMERCSNVAAIKEASGSLEQIQQLTAMVPGGVKVYSGDDALFYPALAMGAHGVVSVAAHVVGNEMEQLWKDFIAGRVDQARDMHQKLIFIMKELFRLPNPIPLKWVLNYLGFAVGDVRLPLVTPEQNEVFEPLVRMLHGMGINPMTTQEGAGTCAF